MTTQTAQTAPTADVPDTERCHTWHANRYLAAHGHPTLPACTCCTEPEESAT